MYHPTTRVLTVLELLQSYGRLSGAELAKRLEVDIRTLRRYIAMLQDLGIPVVGERGRYGAYELGSGFKLPPMMFSNTEALVLVLGLLAAPHWGLAESVPAIESARAKLERVLPIDLKTQVRALTETITLNWATEEKLSQGEILSTLSYAAQQKRRVRLLYKSSQGDETDRDFDPYGLVFHAGKWYLVGWCTLRHALRTFRLDHVTQATLTDQNFVRPERFDALAFVLQTLTTIPRRFPFKVILNTDLETAEYEMQDTLGVLESCPSGIVLNGSTDDLDWLARQLARLPFEFVVREPEMLRVALRQRASELARMATRG